MFGFPVNLFDGGLTPVKLTPDANSGFPKIQQREIFYSIKDGFFDDPSTWETTSGRVGLLPGPNDDVYVRNYLYTSNTTSKNFTINNLFIAKNATLQTTQGSFVINLFILGNLNCQGTINAVSNTGFGLIIYLYARETIINNYVIDSFSSVSKIIYASNTEQLIAPLTYRNLGISGNGIKYLNGDVVVSRETELTGPGKLELGVFNFTSLSATFVGSNLSKNSNIGTTIFYGLVLQQQGSVNITGNADIEIRGQIVHNNSFNGAVNFYSGTGTWRFTTINGSIVDSNANGVLPFLGNIFIDNGLTLTIGINGTGTRVAVKMYGNIIGGNASSRLINADYLYFMTTQAAFNCMVGSLFDFTTYPTNIVFYDGNYSITLDPRFTTYGGLTIGGTGTKSLGVNTTLNGNFNGSTSTGVFEMSTFNFQVGGTTTISGSNFTFSKTGTGNLVFIGNVNLGNTNTINFSGNPTIEYRGGIQFVNSNFTSGTGQITFSTNNQTLANAGSTIVFNNSILISGAITLTTNSSSSGIMEINNTIDGNNASSTLLNGAALYFRNSSFVFPMSSFGVFNFTTLTTSVIGYVFNGNYTLPSTRPTYQGLFVAGTGIKTLSTNTTIQQNLTIASNNYPSSANFECSIYDLSVNGLFSIHLNSTHTFSKNGAGNLLFIGSADFGNVSNIVFSGNPNVEFRGGIFFVNTILTSGTGTWTFSTNNQTLSNGGFSINFNCQVLISGAITLTLSSFSSGLIFYNNTINGNNANSKLLVAASNTINYFSATQPMATGILDTSTNLNTWIYGNLNQDIKGSPTISPKQVYRNLTLNGLGIKTLQGYVSVLNTYTLTAPATLLNNGFTLTNP